MAIKDAKKTALGPVYHVFLRGRLHDVEDYADSIFIVVANNPLVGVSGISHDVSVLPDAALGGFPTRQIEGRRVWRGTIP